MASRPTSASSRRAWLGGSHANEGMEDDEGPAAMESEQYVDGRVVVKQGATEPDVDAEEPKGGCWYKFKVGLRSFWATRQTEDTKEDRELYITTTLRELIVYVIFLIVLMILTFCMTSETTYYYTKVMMDLFLDGKFADDKGSFRTTSTIDDFWKFSKKPLMDGLYWDKWYNNWNVTSAERNFIYYENKLLGVPRLRQVKVRPDSCDIASDFQAEIKQCYAMYSEGVQDTNPFGLMNTSA